MLHMIRYVLYKFKPSSKLGTRQGAPRKPKRYNSALPLGAPAWPSWAPGATPR